MMMGGLMKRRNQGHHARPESPDELSCGPGVHSGGAGWDQGCRSRRRLGSVWAGNQVHDLRGKPEAEQAK
jgi:hypothetical protein